MVHEVGHSRNRGGGEGLRLEGAGIRDGRRRDGRFLRVVEVVGEADGDATLLCGDELAADDRVELRRQVEVVDRDLERLLRGGDELGERVSGLLGRLAAVGQRADFDASHSALCAFFAAW